jgi:hypothetical protein
MNIRKIKIGVRDDIVDRADPSLLSKTGNGWSNVEYTIDQLISHIKKGHPVTHQFTDGKKKKDYFLRTDLLFADIDKGMTIDEALDNDLIKNFASFIYTTPRHSPDAHRFRVIFVLDRTIFSSDAYEAMYRSLLTKIPTDPNTASSAQFFNGCTTTQIYPIGKTLSEEQMNTMESGPNLDIEVDGEDFTATEVLNLPVPNFEKAALSRVVTSKLKPEDDTYTLFIESWDRGSFTLEMEAEYDPSKLSLYIENQILPDGSIESVVNPSYEGGDFEFDGSDNRGHDIYIVTPDGERHEL